MELDNLILKKIIFLNIVVGIWLMIIDVIWLKSHRNATYCIDFNIVIRILNTPVSAKMAQGQRKWRAVISVNIWYPKLHDMIIDLQLHFRSWKQYLSFSDSLINNSKTLYCAISDIPLVSLMDWASLPYTF